MQGSGDSGVLARMTERRLLGSLRGFAVQTRKGPNVQNLKIEGIKNTIAVASSKGCVGKSTTAGFLTFMDDSARHTIFHTASESTKVMAEEDNYTKDGTVDYQNWPANRKKTRTWKVCPFIL
ncbi:protein nrt1/ ptr family 8.1 [Phtheirospermum japonicum]|uniref:Protein nrt1/ ptr family 8.1 n=1 Tax=Phtheirospermum japonicum TaxID=374723 RepID=A0A830CCF8_9LAMI|nr:protein nrt1/ ptr family 8.1 [Phtheirospermum japonicum]